MSVINRKPLIITVLQSLSSDQIDTLKGLINGLGEEPVFRSLIPGSPTLLTDADEGIKRVKLELGRNLGQSVYRGYLIYTDEHKVLISYATETSQELSLVVLENVGGIWEYTFRSCGLTINELRSELDDANEGDFGVSEVASVTNLTDAQIDALECGDVIVKKTGKQRHSYRVSYKEAKQGICLTYSDASIVETVSYDYSGGHWVYNSTDVTELGTENVLIPSIASLDNEKTYVLKCVNGVLTWVEETE